MKRLFLAIALTFCACIFLPSVVLATTAGSCIFSFSGDIEHWYQLQYVCTSDASGNVTNPTITNATGNSIKAPYNREFAGEIKRVQIIPGTSMSAGNLYLYSSADASASDDILVTLGTSLSTSAWKTDIPVTTIGKFPRVIFSEYLVPKATGLGTSKSVTLKVTILNSGSVSIR